jgi:glycosyltransferase involved in cell wall biosynthesis
MIKEEVQPTGRVTKNGGGHATVERALSVSLVVPTRDRNNGLEICLKAASLLKMAPQEIIVVDSAPTGEGAKEVAMRWRARYIREDEPGVSRARNRGAHEACGDIVAFTDDDAAPDVNWLDSIVQEFQDPLVALVVGKVVPPAGKPELDRLYRLCGFTGQGDERVIVDRDVSHWFEKVTFLPFGVGPNLAIRRTVFKQWRGFDVRLGPGTPVPGHEEQRAFLELIDLGFRLVYAPTSRVIHPLPAPSVIELRTRRLYRMQASSAYFTMLFVEDPRHRREILEYIMSKLWGESDQHDVVAGEYIPRMRRFLARLRGPLLYFKSRSKIHD